MHSLITCIHWYHAFIDTMHSLVPCIGLHSLIPCIHWYHVFIDTMHWQHFTVNVYYLFGIPEEKCTSHYEQPGQTSWSFVRVNKPYTESVSVPSLIRKGTRAVEKDICTNNFITYLHKLLSIGTNECFIFLTFATHHIFRCPETFHNLCSSLWGQKKKLLCDNIMICKECNTFS